MIWREMMFNLKDAFFVPSAKYPTQLEWEDFFLIRLYQIAHYTKSPRTGIAGGRGIDSRRAQIFYYFVLYRAAVCICLPYELGKYIYGTPRTEDRIPDSWDSRILGIAGKVAGSIPDELRNEYYYFRTVEPVHLGYVHLLFTTFLCSQLILYRLCALSFDSILCAAISSGEISSFS